MDIVSNKTKLNTNKQIYECSVCGELFNWSSQSSWYGSYKQMEEHPDKIKYFCSDKCVSNGFVKPKAGG